MKRNIIRLMLTGLVIVMVAEAALYHSQSKMFSSYPAVVHAVAICDQTPWHLTTLAVASTATVSLPAPANGCNRHIITSVEAGIFDSFDAYVCAPVLYVEDNGVKIYSDVLNANQPYHNVDHIEISFPTTPDSGGYGQYGWTGLRASGALTALFGGSCGSSTETINIQGFDIPCAGTGGAC